MLLILNKGGKEKEKKMPSQILPVTHHHRGTEAAAMLIKAEIERDDPTTSLLISSEYEDVEKAITNIKPVLSRTSSYNNNNITSPNDSPRLGNCYQQRRRRSASDNSLSSLSGSNGSGAASSAGGSRRHSFSKDVGRAAAETFLVTRLSFKLLRYLGYAAEIIFFLIHLFNFFFSLLIDRLLII